MLLIWDSSGLMPAFRLASITAKGVWNVLSLSMAS